MGWAWTASDTWIVTCGSLCAAACALPGAFLVLRRMSMMGDAISHAVLPGLALAFLITGSRDPFTMLLGAAGVGLLTALLVQAVHSYGRTEVGAAMGIVFTTLFALGVLLMRQAADSVDLDPGCVLYGAIELAFLDRVPVAGVEVPRAALVNGAAALVNLGLILALFKEFRISAFDPALATTLGVSAAGMHYLLMAMTAATAVAAFETVGSILVVAMFIIPPAAAYLLTDRLWVMVCLSVGIGAAAAVAGHVAAVALPPWLGFEGTSTAGMMAATAGAIFVVVWLAAPRQGLMARHVHRARLRGSILQQDLLGLLYRLEERGQAERATPPFLARAAGAAAWRVGLALRRLRAQGSLERRNGTHRLTAQGRRGAADLVRTHRLWESFLHQHLPLPADHVHATAERLEHLTDRRMQEALLEATGSPVLDPHGRDIPAPPDA
jgi:manganese/zinc/iron transport system permease protein